MAKKRKKRQQDIRLKAMDQEILLPSLKGQQKARHRQERIHRADSYGRPMTRRTEWGDDGSVGLFSHGSVEIIWEKRKRKKKDEEIVHHQRGRQAIDGHAKQLLFLDTRCLLVACLHRSPLKTRAKRTTSKNNRRPYLRVVSRRTAFQQRMRIPSPRLPSGRSFRGGNKQPNLRSSELLRWGLHNAD